MAEMSPAEEIFFKALEKGTATERVEYLDVACAGQPELRARVEKLLAAHPRVGKFLEADLGTSETLMYEANQPPAIEGTVVAGKYKLLQQIGEGGMGTVWMADQTEPVKRRVAVKLIRVERGNAKMILSRFEAERQAIALMDHPNIARLLDAGTTDMGQPYFVMELVKGFPLTEYCDAHKLRIPERLALFQQVCSAVQHAHQKGIIHRDLKPTNILVESHDGQPVPKVIDFGLAKATSGLQLTEHTLFTAFGNVMGTPTYMAPEQATFNATDIDTRADVYSLGVILYELLTGTTPITRESVKKAALDEMLKLVREQEAPKPSTRLSSAGSKPDIAANRNIDPAKLSNLLQGDLDWVVLMALEKDRTRRYESANGLAADIQRYLSNELVLARPPSTLYRMQKFVRRHRVGVTAAGAVLMALVLGLTLATYGLISARADREIADNARIEAQAQKKIADDQRQAAIISAKRADDNAKQAEENAREAKLQLVHGRISQADVLSLSGRFLEAHPLYTDAYDKLTALRAPLTSAEVGLWSSYHQAAHPLLTFSGHTGSVSSVAIAPDGKTALSGSMDKTLKLWDLATGRELRTFTGHTDWVHQVAITPDGRTAVSAGHDKTLKLWDLASGKELRTFIGHAGYVLSVAIAPDGKTALSGSADGTLKLWDLASGMDLRTRIGGTNWMHCVAISPDGRTALSGCSDRTLKLWDLNSGKELRTLSGHTALVFSVAIAPDGKTALSGSTDLKLWDLTSGKELRTLTGHTSPVYSVAIAPNGKTALTASGDKTLKLWDLDTGKEMRSFIGHSYVSSVAIAPDGRTALSGSTDNTVKLWDLKSETELRTLTGHTGSVSSVAVAPDGKTALSGGMDKTLKLWDLATGRELRTFTGHAGRVSSVVILPDGRTALSGSGDSTLKLWDLTSGKELRTFTGNNGMVESVAISPDGKTALSGSWDKTLKLWDLASGKELRTFTGHNGPVFSVAIAPDGRTALSGSEDRTLKLWDLASGKELRTFTGHNNWVYSVAISSDGRTALSAGVEKTLKHWDLASGKELHNFTGHTNTVLGVAFAPDGRTALSGGADRTLRIVDLVSGEELHTFLTGHTSLVRCVAITPDGRTALTGSYDRTLKIWDFSWAAAQRAFEPRVAAAQARLRQAANDPAALATLGEWYAFRGMDQWALEFLSRARDGGAAVAPLTLARCYWNLDRIADARREFQVALGQSQDTTERRYLEWCIVGVDNDAERIAAERQKAELAAAAGLADAHERAGRWEEALKLRMELTLRAPKVVVETRLPTLQLWFGKDADYTATCQRYLKAAEGTEDPSTAERAAKVYCLRPSSDPALLEQAWKLAGRATELGKSHPYLPWYQLALGMAEYRRGPGATADEALAVAEQSSEGNARIQGPARLFHAMSLHRQGKTAEARQLFALAEAQMKPIPASKDKPFENNAGPDDVVFWLVYDEAKKVMSSPVSK